MTIKRSCLGRRHVALWLIAVGAVLWAGSRAITHLTGARVPGTVVLTSASE